MFKIKNIVFILAWNSYSPSSHWNCSKVQKRSLYLNSWYVSLLIFFSLSLSYTWRIGQQTKKSHSPLQLLFIKDLQKGELSLLLIFVILFLLVVIINTGTTSAIVLVVVTSSLCICIVCTCGMVRQCHCHSWCAHSQLHWAQRTPRRWCWTCTSTLRWFFFIPKSIVLAWSSLLFAWQFYHTYASCADPLANAVRPRWGTCVWKTMQQFQKHLFSAARFLTPNPPCFFTWHTCFHAVRNHAPVPPRTSRIHRTNSLAST